MMLAIDHSGGIIEFIDTSFIELFDYIHSYVDS
jgi:hypothetical protein